MCGFIVGFVTVVVLLCPNRVGRRDLTVLHSVAVEVSELLLLVLVPFVVVCVVSMLRLPVVEGSCSGAILTVPQVVVVEEDNDCSVVVESGWRASW